MGARTALRRLEELVRAANLPEGAWQESEECLSALWRHVLPGEDD